MFKGMAHTQEGLEYRNLIAQPMPLGVSFTTSPSDTLESQGEVR